MAVEHIHTYLVRPARGVAKEKLPSAGGTAVPLTGKFFDLLARIYERAIDECKIDILFNRAADGSQQNTCRDLLVDYIGGPTLVRGRRIAARLAGFTTHRSKLGLLFLIAGTEGKNRRLVVSRFPAEPGIVAEESGQALTVEFIERVFMKSPTSYKSVIYQDASPPTAFWTGRAVDRQLNDPQVNLSDYWIFEFLDSDFRTTSAAGTRRLAKALRDASRRATDLSVKQEITAAVTLATGLRGKKISISDFGTQLALSDATKRAIAAEVKAHNLMDEKFQFDLTEFVRLVAYRSVELDTGGIMTAEASKFDRVFRREAVKAGPGTGTERFITEGTVVGEKLVKKAP